MGDNLDFHKMTFCGLFIYCFIGIRKEILGQIVLSDPQGLEFTILSKIWLSHCKQLRDTTTVTET